jgi:hypothetical protein
MIPKKIFTTQHFPQPFNNSYYRRYPLPNARDYHRSLQIRPLLSNKTTTMRPWPRTNYRLHPTVANTHAKATSWKLIADETTIITEKLSFQAKKESYSFAISPLAPTNST